MLIDMLMKLVDRGLNAFFLALAVAFVIGMICG